MQMMKELVGYAKLLTKPLNLGGHNTHF